MYVKGETQWEVRTRIQPAAKILKMLSSLWDCLAADNSYPF